MLREKEREREVGGWKGVDEKKSGRVGRGAGGRCAPPPHPLRRNQRPAPRTLEPPGLAAASRSPSHPPDLFCQTRRLGWHAQARESRSCAARHARAVSRACARGRARCACAHTRAALARIREPRRHAILFSTTYCVIMNDAMLVCIRKCAYCQVDTDQPELQNWVNQQH